MLGNAAGATPKVNLKGIAVGNGCLGLGIGVCAFDYKNERNTNAPFFAGHGLIAPTTFAAVQADCAPDASSASPACQADFDQMHAEVGNVNVYDIYGDCVDGARVDPGRIDKATGRRVFSRVPVEMKSGGVSGRRGCAAARPLRPAQSHPCTHPLALSRRSPSPASTRPSLSTSAAPTWRRRCTSTPT